MTVLACLAAGLALWLAIPASPVIDSARAHRGWAGLATVVLALATVPHDWVAPGLVLGLGVVGALLLWRRRVQTRTAQANAARLAEVCDLLAAELAAGRPTELALDEAASAWPALRPVAEVCRLGGDVPAAFVDVSHVPGAGGLRVLAASWIVSLRTGGGLAPATRRVAEAVRRDQSTRTVVAGELASARATARLVAGLPVLALLMGSGAGADPWAFLLSTRLGLACLASGLAIGFAGLWWIELIARGVDR